MILPIVAYGDPVLRKAGDEIGPDYPALQQLIADMYDTMYNAEGVGLAAPQVGRSIRLFIVDAKPMKDRANATEDLEHFKKVFINPRVLATAGEGWGFEEGCLSIPGIRELVERQASVTLQYVDEQFVQHTETYTGVKARIIQHEYDHVEGILFIDHLTALKRSLLRNKLLRIQKGITDCDYPLAVHKSRVATKR